MGGAGRWAPRPAVRSTALAAAVVIGVTVVASGLLAAADFSFRAADSRKCPTTLSTETDESPLAGTPAGMGSLAKPVPFLSIWGQGGLPLSSWAVSQPGQCHNLGSACSGLWPPPCPCPSGHTRHPVAQSLPSSSAWLSSAVSSPPGSWRAGRCLQAAPRSPFFPLHGLDRWSCPLHPPAQ